MNELKVIVCRLCLKMTSGDSQELNETYKFKISYILPEINISNQHPSACKACLDILQEAYNFKRACVEIESFLEGFVNPMKQLNLQDVISNKMFECEEEKSSTTVGEHNKVICRLCLSAIEGNSFKQIGIIEENILRKCIPEMDLAISKNPVSCNSCMEYIHSHFNFIMKCLDVEEMINNYLMDNNINNGNFPETLTILSNKYYIENMDLEYNHNPNCDTEDQKTGIKKEIDLFHEAGSSKNMSLSDNLYLPIYNSTSQNQEFYTPGESINLTPRPEFKCDDCPYVTNRKYSLRVHSLIHKKIEDITLYRCPQCPHQTKRKSNLMTHLIMHKNPSDVQMHLCKHCPYKTRLRSNLIRHQLKHKPPEEIFMHRCEHCPYQTKLKGNLLIHLIQHKTPEELVMHRCGECSYATKLKNNLKKHILVHRKPEEVTMYNCTTCDYQSKWKAHLMRHMSMHNMEEIELRKCTQCPYVATQKYNLKKHLLTHKSVEEIEMHKCDLCDFQTKRKDKIKQHMANMHICNVCGYQNKDKRELVDHVESHKITEDKDDENTFKCDMCNYKAKQKRYLQRHKKKAHPVV